MLKKVNFDFDLAIIGSGAGGSVGAHYAASMGKKVVIFEKGAIGGECPNFACVPTKALLHSAQVYETVLNSEIYGIEKNDVKINFNKVNYWKDLVVERTGATHGEKSFRSDHISVIRSKAQFLTDHQLLADGQKITAKKILIASGSQTFVPPIEGLDEAGYLTFKEAVDLKKLPESIFILGGGPIGCEFSQIFATFGVKVILADTLDRLIAKEDGEVSELIKALFENMGIKVLTKVSVDKVEKKNGKKFIHFTDGGQSHTLAVDEILVATGKKPVLDFGVEKAGIKVEKGHISVNPYLQTNVPNIFAAGDVVGPYLFTHTGYYQSWIAVHNMFSYKKIRQNFKVVPRCVFTKPEVASVGITEYQAKEEGIKIKKGMAAISMLGRANTSNELDGFVKIITDKHGVIIGGAIIAPSAGEMIHEVALAIQTKTKAQTLADMLHAYPTFSEGIKIACSLVE